METLLTHHAECRMQQRSITQLEMELILIYGSESYSHGCTRCSLDRRAYKRLRKDLERLMGRIDSLQGKYVVSASDSSVVTVGHKHKSTKNS